jgi:cation transport regulator
MPYKEITDLPAAVREHLPQHAQEIYLAAFNSAWEQYRDPQRRRAGGSREATAHRVAWGAVEKVYSKQPNGHWQRRAGK